MLRKIYPPAFRLTLLAICLGSVSQLHAEAYPLRDAVEFTPRDGLPNFFHKLESNGKVTIAYLGGSITAQNGWRVLSQKWFEEQYPQAGIKGIDAAIGGTGSSLGVFRVEKDALEAKPDLLFVEFAVNDARDRPENITKAMEGIVRKTWRLLPETDICFVYTMNSSESEQVAGGKMNRSSSVMESIADHYGIPSIHLGYQVALLEKENKLVMKTDAPMTRVSGEELDAVAEMATDAEGRIIFSKDGVHPYTETGHVLYTEALIRSMEQIRDRTRRSPHLLKAPIREDNWEAAQQIPIPDQFLSGPYTNLAESNASLAKRFSNRMQPIYRLEPGATLSFKFKGTKAVIYDLVGPDGGLVEITLDGQTKQNKRMDGYCTYHRLSTLHIGDQLEDKVHTVSIRVQGDAFDKGEILFEKNRSDFEKFPEKYTDYFWHPGAIFIVGEIVE